MRASPAEGEVPVRIAGGGIGVLEVPSVAVGRIDYRQDQLAARHNETLLNTLPKMVA